jgi:hypothetical protein
MEKQYFVEGNLGVKPDAFSYSTTIQAISNSHRNNDIGKRTEVILNRMKHLCKHAGGAKPNTVVYNAIINSWAIHGGRHAAFRAKAILEYMELESQSGNIETRPNIVTYNTVLKTLANGKYQNVTNEADELLTRMEKMYNDGSNEIIPDQITYTTVMTTHARSNKKDKAQNAANILHRMIESYDNGNKLAKPTAFAFNACLNACAYTNDPKRKVNAFLTLVRTLMLFQKYTKLDHISYGTLLRAFCNLLPQHEEERKNQIIASVFKQCCKEGQVGHMVLQQMRFATAASPELYRSLIGRDINDDEIDLSSLPERWSRNVRER